MWDYKYICPTLYINIFILPICYYITQILIYILILQIIEEQLRVTDRQRRTEFGVIDLLCKDKDGKYVIVEVKMDPDHSAVAQIAKYVLSLEKEGIQRDQIRWILVTKHIGAEVHELCKYFNIETRSLALASSKSRRKSCEVLTITSYKDESAETMPLFPREHSILRAIFNLNQTGKTADYPSIANKLRISASTVRDFVNNMIKKEVPIIKQRMLPSGLKFKLNPELEEKLNKDQANF